MTGKIRFLLWGFSVLSLLPSIASIRPVPGVYSTIRAAIQASVSGDTIVVSPGIYHENINFRGKNVVLTSLYYLSNDTSYIRSTVIDGSNPIHPDTASCVIISSGEDSTAVLQGFMITGGSGTKWLDIHGAGLYREGGGILIELSSPTIIHNIITGNSATDITGVTSAGGGGIRIGDGYPVICNNIISENQGRYGAGIVLNYTGCRIRNNLIFNNSGGQEYYGGSGIWIYANKGTYKKYIENNTIVCNSSTLSTGTGGISSWSATNVVIRNNIIRNNLPGVQIKTVSSTPAVTFSDISGGYTGTGNIDTEPQFTSQSFFLNDGSPCIDTGDPSSQYNDPAQPGNPALALFPAKGTVTSDMGAYGGPYSSLLPCVSTVTAIPDQEQSSTFRVFPNPARDFIKLRSDVPLDHSVLTVFNMDGQQVARFNDLNGKEILLNLKDFIPGKYIFRLTGNVQRTKTVIVACRKESEK